jgi:RHS repeat-associated protein
MSGISSKAAGTLANNYKFGGKEMQNQEFSDGSGLEQYDFGARNYDHQIGRWNSVDPLAGHPNQVGMSPYSAYANNPIRYVDPTGKIWEDPKDAERLNKSVNNRIESINKDNIRIQAQIDKGGLSEKKLAKLQDKLSENSQKIGLLNQSLTDIKAIGEAKETYTLSGPSKSDGTHGVVKNEKGVIQIEGTNTGLHLHEIRHVGQSIEAGGVRFNSKGELLNSASTKAGGRNNEINAYQVGYSYDGQYPVPANSLKDINAKSLMEIKREDGTPVYEKLKD